MTSDVMSFVAKWGSPEAMRTFVEEERRDRPDHALFLWTSRKFNRRYSRTLGRIKRKAQIVRDEVYVSFLSSETVVHLGIDLLRREIRFNVSLDIRRLSEESRKSGKPFSFERSVMREFDRCETELEQMAEEFELLYPAVDLEGDVLLKVLERLRNERKQMVARVTQSGRYQQSEGSMDEISRLSRQIRRLENLIK